MLEMSRACLDTTFLIKKLLKLNLIKNLLKLLKHFSFRTSLISAFNRSRMKLLTLIAFFVFSVNCEKARYDNYRVYEILMENKDHLDLMHEIEKYPDGVITMENISKGVAGRWSSCQDPDNL